MPPPPAAAAVAAVTVAPVGGTRPAGVGGTPVSPVAEVGGICSGPGGPSPVSVIVPPGNAVDHRDGVAGHAVSCRSGPAASGSAVPVARARTGVGSGGLTRQLVRRDRRGLRAEGGLDRVEHAGASSRPSPPAAPSR